MKKVFFSTYVKKVETLPQKITDDNYQYRYSLEILFKDNEEGATAIVIMKNPSMAGKVDKKTNTQLSDDTVYSVCDYIHKKGFRKLKILNLFPIYGGTFKNIALDEPARLEGEGLNSQENDRIIGNTIESLNTKDKIILAWGGYPDLNRKSTKISTQTKTLVKQLYDERIRTVLGIIGDRPTYKVGKGLTNGVFPAHGKNWYDYEPLLQFTHH